MGSITVLFTQSKGTINRNIYGHFAEHIGGVFRDGLWVGENAKVENIRGFRKALVESFARINPPVLRWPGGCFAETYDWRDGIGPRGQRPRRIGWWFKNDGRVETNEVGTHEFIDFCRMTGAQPYFAANITSMPALHMRNWMEYCNAPAHLTALADERAANGSEAPFDVKYWGIGNENWGGGGRMTAEMYAHEFLRFATVCENLPFDMTLVACGPYARDVDWTHVLMRTLAEKHVTPSALSVHYYCGTAGAPQSFTEEEWYQQLHQANYIQNIVDDHRAAMDEFDPDRKTVMFVDEWGCWHRDGSGPSKGFNLFEQQSCMRDAVVAALTLNIFNNRCDAVAMANVAQLCNNLHSLYLADAERFVETPNYFVFDMYKTHQGARQLEIVNDCGAFGGGEAFRPAARQLDRVSASASQAEDGTVTITLANTSMTEAADVRLRGHGSRLDGQAEVITLAADDPHACNTFEDPKAVQPTLAARAFRDGDSLTLPPASVVAVRIRP